MAQVYRTFEVWPSDLQQTLMTSGIQITPIPPWDDKCAMAETTGDLNDGQKPTITSPQMGVEYHVHLNGGENSLPLNATADGEIHMLHWFVNNQYLGNSSPTTPLLWHMAPGDYRIQVVDDRGHSDTISTHVTSVP